MNYKIESRLVAVETELVKKREEYIAFDIKTLGQYTNIIFFKLYLHII